MNPSPHENRGYVYISNMNIIKNSALSFNEKWTTKGAG